jgi:hypothetical protein
VPGHLAHPSHPNPETFFPNHPANCANLSPTETLNKTVCDPALPFLPTRKEFGRPIYKLCLTISLILAVSYSLSSVYGPQLLQSPDHSLCMLGYTWQVR